MTGNVNINSTRQLFLDDHVCCQSAKVGRIGTRENYCYGEPALSSLAAEL